MVMKKAVLALVALWSLWPIHSYSQEKIRIGYGAMSIQSGLVWIAKQKGLFSKYGLAPEIIYIPGGTTNIQALISGNLILKRIGLDPAKDVTILQIGGEPERSAALKTGRIDGTVMNAPFGAEAEKQKLNILADSLKMGIPFFNTGVLGSRRILEQQEKKVLNFLRAYVEAIKVLKTEREFSIKALSQFTRVQDLKIVAEGYDYFKDEIQTVPYPSLEAMQALVAQMAETNPKAKRVDPKTYISDRYLRQLEDEGFVKRIWGR